MLKENSLIISYFNRCARECIMDYINDREDSMLEFFSRSWDIQPGDLILEPACGSGRFTRWISSRIHKSFTLFSFDMAPYMVEKAKRTDYRHKHLFFRGSSHCLPFLNLPFDRIIMINAFPHFESKSRCISEMYRSLRFGGALFINHFENKDRLNNFHAGLPWPINNHQIPEDDIMRGMLADEGFRRILIDSGNDYYMLSALK